MRDLKDARVCEPGTRWLRLRVALVGLLFAAGLGVAFARAFYLQVVDRARMLDMAQDQYLREMEIPARRGDIFDRRGVPLAQSVEVESIWADPSQAGDVRRAARALARRLELDPGELAARLERGKRFAWVKRQVRPDEVARAKALGIPGVGFAKEPRRFYPQRELAAHLLGIVGTDGRGLEGLELAFDEELSGEEARISGVRDARGRKLLVEGAYDALDREGADVTLTIDRQLQYLAEKALAAAVQQSGGVGGMAVALDPKTGELLALANFPSFNPNNPAPSSHALMRDRAALDAFEPGSTTKPLVVAAGLDSGALSADDIFFCENGAYDIGQHTIHDTKPHGWLSPTRILQVSSNIGMAKIGETLGRERLVSAYRQFGFGEKVGLALPGEGRGQVPYPKAEISLATQAFGQGLSATAVQLAAAYGALANRGILMRPFLVAKVVDPDGVVLLENKPTEIRQVVSARVAQQVLHMLEGTVAPDGTAPRARLDGYRVAGKTGTAQKADPVARGYSEKRIASFAGVVPADDPRLVVLVVIDEPKTDVFGGLIAAPAFKEIAQGAMTYLGVPPSLETPLTRGLAPAREEPAAAVQPPPQVSEAVTAQVGAGAVAVPDVSGKVGREAVAALLAAALEPQLSGSGRVVSQDPAAGARVQRGARVALELTARP
jgi:cell division protein FtsI (penicillin-binding protein 3)